jgi:hypothetical protein
MIGKTTMSHLKKVILTLSLSLFTASVWAHSAPLDTQALDVCKLKEKSQSCQYQGHHNDLYIGTCQLVDDQNLTCVRNQPIIKLGESSANSGSEKPLADDHH